MESFPMQIIIFSFSGKFVNNDPISELTIPWLQLPCCKIWSLNENESLTVNPLTTSVPHHKETSQLICRANQLIGFYIMGNTGC